MSQEMKTTPALPATTLTVEETTVPVGFQAIAKKVVGGDNKTAIMHLGEDSATPFIFTGTLTVGEETTLIDESGHIEIGASYTRAQTSAFKTTNAVRDCIALMGMLAPKMGDAIQASMLASRDGGDSAQALIDHGFNITEAALDRANAFMASLASESTRTVSASVKVSLDE